MKKQLNMLVVLIVLQLNVWAQDQFPDGSPVPGWFRQVAQTDISKLGKQYIVTDYGVTAADSNLLQTDKIQAIIDKAAADNGGVIIIPKGVYLSGSLFFKPKTHLHLTEGATLKGSDDVSNFKLVMTRMEGQTLTYFAALVNADGVDGFTVSGKGTLNGNGLTYWKHFWLRREFNPQCTNMDEMRPRVLYVSNSKDVQISGIHLINSAFWTSHYYKCENLKLLNLIILSPFEPVKAPSSDAIDLDACKNVLVKNCYMSVNDDAIALKGGKGPGADKDSNNAGNYNIIIEDNTYGRCHSMLTCGSESVHNRNIILRRCTTNGASRLLHLKMRPDTPQLYEFITVEDISGSVKNFIDINPWTQFYDMKGEQGIKMSYASNIVMRNINLECETVFNVKQSDQYELSKFTFENLHIKASDNSQVYKDYIKDFTLKDVVVNGKVL